MPDFFVVRGLKAPKRNQLRILILWAQPDNVR